MIFAQFSKDMLQILKRMQGNIFSYYIYGNCFGDYAYGNIRIATETFAVDITNIEEEFIFLGDTANSTEELSCFRCKKEDIESQFLPYIEESSVAKILVEERITSIEIITDTVKIDQENYCIALDMALIIHTDKHSYTFSRDWFFSEVININVDKDFDNIYSIDQVKDSWSDDGDYTVEVSRHKTTL